MNNIALIPRWVFRPWVAKSTPPIIEMKSAGRYQFCRWDVVWRGGPEPVPIVAPPHLDGEVTGGAASPKPHRASLPQVRRKTDSACSKAWEACFSSCHMSRTGPHEGNFCSSRPGSHRLKNMPGKKISRYYREHDFKGLMGGGYSTST